MERPHFYLIYHANKVEGGRAAWVEYEILEDPGREACEAKIAHKDTKRVRGLTMN